MILDLWRLIVEHNGNGFKDHQTQWYIKEMPGDPHPGTISRTGGHQLSQTWEQEDCLIFRKQTLVSWPRNILRNRKVTYVFTLRNRKLVNWPRDILVNRKVVCLHRHENRKLVCWLRDKLRNRRLGETNPNPARAWLKSFSQRCSAHKDHLTFVSSSSSFFIETPKG